MKKILTIILAILVAIGGASCIAVLVKKGDSGGGGSSGTKDSSYVDPAECDHSVTEWIVAYEPSCTEDGKETLRCKKCKSDLKDERAIPKLGHDNGEWVVTITADCTTPGEKILKCTRCEAELKKEEIPTLGHDDGEWVVDFPATCAEPGREVLKCGRCEEELDEKEIPALGHVEVKDAAVAATCTHVGMTAGKHCSRCNTVLISQTDIPALGHDVVIDTCTSDKSYGSHCGRCNTVLIAQRNLSGNLTYGVGGKWTFNSSVDLSQIEGQSYINFYCSLTKAVYKGLLIESGTMYFIRYDGSLERIDSLESLSITFSLSASNKLQLCFDRYPVDNSLYEWFLSNATQSS